VFSRIVFKSIGGVGGGTYCHLSDTGLKSAKDRADRVEDENIF
jgi:hypothetical protein